MTNVDCSAFQFEDNVCKLLKSTGLYLNAGEGSPIDVYMVDSDAGTL